MYAMQHSQLAEIMNYGKLKRPVLHFGQDLVGVAFTVISTVAYRTIYRDRSKLSGFPQLITCLQMKIIAVPAISEVSREDIHTNCICLLQ